MEYKKRIMKKLFSIIVISLHICVFTLRDAAVVYAQKPSSSHDEQARGWRVDESATQEDIAAETNKTKEADKEEPEVSVDKKSLSMTAMAAGEGDGTGGNAVAAMNLNALNNLGPSLFAGAATYSIPIAVLPGRKGIEPNISLTYSSQSGNGMLGVGWSLDVGSIERSTKKGVPNYDNSDTFLFKSGGATVELVNIGGNEYRAKIEGAFMKFIFDGNSWLVKDKNGICYYFGQNAVSQIVSGTKIFAWCLDRVVDMRGNYMTITYIKEANQIYPDTINYTGNELQDLDPAFQVDFDYLGSRPDYFFSYRSNFLIQTNKLLNTITVKQNGQRVRKYSIAYEQSQSTKRSLLKSVIQYGIDDSIVLPPIDLSYQVKPFSFSPIAGWANIHNFGDTNWQSIRATSGEDTYVDIFDINRDGLPDRVLRGKNSQDYNKLWVQLNNGSSFDNLIAWSDIAASSQQLERASVRYGSQHGRTNTFDIDADGLPDRVYVYYQGDYSRWEVQKNNGEDFESSVAWANVNGFHDQPNYSMLWGFAGGGWQYIDIFDMNGDGLSDRIIKSIADDRWYVQLNNGNGFDNTVDWLNLQYDPSGGHSSELYLRTGGSSVYFATFDINGDGLPDHLMDHDRWSNNTWNVQFNNGKSFENISTWGALEHVGSDWSFMFYGDPMCTNTVDINGDGLADRVMRNYSDQYGDWEVQINNGHGFEPVVFWGPIEHNGDYQRAHIRAGYNPAIVDLFDINGDGLPDRVMRGYSSCDHWDVQFNEGPFPDLLNKIENGIGGSATITYESYIGHDNTELADQKNLSFPVYVVTQIQTSDGRGNSYATSYSYDKAAFDYQEREFRGFGKVTQTDAEGNYSIKYFHQSDYDKGRIYKEEVYDAAGNLFAKTENAWQSQEPYPGYPESKFIYLSETNAYVYDGDASGRRTKTQCIFAESPQHGNPTQVIEFGEVNIESGEDIGQDRRSTFTEYVYNSADWIVSLPKHVCARDYYDNKISEKWFYYDSNPSVDDTPIKGLLTKEEVRRYNPLTGVEDCVSSSYSYDDYGNLLSSTDANQHTSTVAYDQEYFIFPLSAANCLGHSTATEYYGVNGVPLNDGAGLQGLFGQVRSTRDPNQAVSYKTYDGLGREEKVIGPNDSINYPAVLYAYDFDVTDPHTDPVKLTQKVKAAAAPSSFDFPDYYPSYSFYDGLGRIILSKTQAESDPSTHQQRQIISGVTTYNCRGLAEKKYLPYFGSASADFIQPNYAQSYSQTIYDPVGRVVQAVNPDSTYSTVSYSDWIVTATDEEGHHKTYYYDASQRLVRVDEHNEGQIHTTGYEYDTAGNLVKVTDNEDNITTIIYDSLGRKILMNDPDMGIWNYEYDNAGNLTKQIDAAGQQLEFQYDAVNRLTQKTIQESQTVVYEYDDPGKDYSIGRLTKVTYEAGSAEFFYDNLGREVRSIKTVDSQSYEVCRSYDSLNRLSTLTYPDGEVLNYAYNPQGIETVTGASAYVNNIDYSPTSQMVKINYGNGTSTVYEYNPQTLRLEHLTSFDSQQAAIQDFAYTFDSVGNIETITDAVNTATQSFTYDHLNRLKTASGASYGFINYAYDSLGNIQTKGSLSLQYNDSRPHAVSSYTNSQTGQTVVFGYDANGNMRTRTNQATGERTDYFYDYESRLTKVEQRYQVGQATQVALEFQPGWNFFSLACVPDGADVAAALDDLEFGTDYDQVSQYNPATGTFEHFVNDMQFNQFDALEYGKGYCIHISNTQPVTVTIEGSAPAVQSIAVRAGWNLVPYPYLSSSSIQEGLGNLVFGIDYDEVLSYNPTTGSFESFSADGPGRLSQLEPGKSYYLHCLQDANWEVKTLSRTTEFFYDGDGGRVKRRSEIDNGTTTIYIGSLFEKNVYDDPQKPTVTKKHIYAGSNRVCVADNGALRFYHSDHLGSSNLVTDGAGAQLSLIEYSPFGEVSNQSGSYSTDIKFTGKIQDDTGLYYYGARYYDPIIGRFITPDTIVQAPQDPQSLNRYAYCRNNPVKYIDPTGHWFWAAIFAIVKGAMVGAAIGAGLSAVTGDIIGQGALLGAITGAFFSGAAFFGEGLEGGMKILARSVTGASSGAAGAAAIGVDPSRGAWLGAIGGVTFGAISDLGGKNWKWDLGRVGLSGVAGGAISELAGGDFLNGFIFAGTIAGADFVYRSILSSKGRLGASMKTAEKEGQPKLDVDEKPLIGQDGKKIVLQPDYKRSNVGTRSKPSYDNSWDDFKNQLTGETGIVMNTLGLRVPGFQGLSLAHDPLGNFIETTFGQTTGQAVWGVINIPTMAPIYGLNLVGSAINDNPTYIGLHKTLEDE